MALPIDTLTNEQILMLVGSFEVSQLFSANFLGSMLDRVIKNPVNSLYHMPRGTQYVYSLIKKNVSSWGVLTALTECNFQYSDLIKIEDGYYVFKYDSNIIYVRTEDVIVVS